MFCDLTMNGRVFQTDSAVSEKGIWPSECVHTEGQQRIKVSDKNMVDCVFMMKTVLTLDRFWVTELEKHDPLYALTKVTVHPT